MKNLQYNLKARTLWENPETVCMPRKFSFYRTVQQIIVNFISYFTTLSHVVML